MRKWRTIGLRPWLARLAMSGLLLATLAALLWSLGDGAGALAQEVRNTQGIAVIVGNKVYTDRDVPEVSFAHRDADAFRRYVVDVLGYDPENIIDLRDASQAKMEAAFGNERSHEGRLWRYLNPDGGSDVVVFYSGHGVPGLRDGRGYLLPVDANPNTAEINGYPIDLLYENLGKLEDARSVQVFLDACFSGDSHSGMLVRAASPVNISVSLPTGLGGKVTWLTAASGAQVASWDEEAGHGLFTHHLLDALYGAGDADENGRVTAQEAKAYLDRHMTRAARRLFGRHQQADLKEAGEAVLASAPPDGMFPQRPDLGDPDPVGGAGREDGQDDTDPAQIVLPEGYTVADWALLAESRLEQGDHAALLAEANKHIRAYGALAPLKTIRERAASSLAADIRFSTKEEAREALERIARIEEEAGEQPPLLRLQARAHKLLADYSSEADAHVRWLQAVPQSHQERPEVIAALSLARAVISDSQRFSELLDRPFSVDAENSVGWTDLHYAALLDLPGVVTALLDAEVPVDVRLKAGSTPFGDGLTRILNALGHGGRLLKRTLSALEHEEEFDDLRANGETPLMIASAVNAAAAARELIHRGADVRNENYEGDMPVFGGHTPLHFASAADALDVVNLLLEHEEVLYFGSGVKSTFPLHYAAKVNAHEVAQALLRYGFDVDETDLFAQSPLHIAAIYGAKETAKVLLANGANVDYLGSRDERPLHSAAFSNTLGMVQILVEQGADIDGADNYGSKAMHYAAKGNALDVAKWLVEQGEDIHEADDNGDTPLHYTTYGYSNAIEMAEWLIERGAEASAMNEDGVTPLDEAKSRGEVELERALRSAAQRQAAARERLARDWPAGKEFRECDQCPVMVVVPPGRFDMGNPDDETDHYDDQGPVHIVTIRERFAVGKFEVTFAEWAACVSDRGCEEIELDDQDWGRGKKPVVYMTHDSALSYVSWLKQKTGGSYRLLTEAEWEYAARAGTTTVHSWGDEFRGDLAHCWDCTERFDLSMPAPVGSFPANDFGLHDMHGNVWEWVEDCWNERYDGAPTNGSAWMDGMDVYCDKHVIRGGSYKSPAFRLGSAVRVGRGFPEKSSYWYVHDIWHSTLGFRVARTLSN